MDQNSIDALDQIPANRRLVNELFAHGKISAEAKDYALEFLYPSDKWGLWISRLFLAVGTALILSGVVYFFAFNWAKITPLIKLSSLQVAMLACLAGAYHYKLERVSGQILLLSASVLTGVFMAVFGQIYQTGADAYQLFMMWSLLILGWTVISKFAPQWVVWLAITNVALVLWWEQGALPDRDSEAFIFAYVTALNAAALVFREIYVERRDAAWLDYRWLRVLLTIAVLVPATIPVVGWIVDAGAARHAVVVSALAGLAAQGLLYAIYRFKIGDMWSLAAVALSVCVVLEAGALRLIAEALDGTEIVMFLLMGIATLAIFSVAVIYLRKVIPVLEAKHV